MVEIIRKRGEGKTSTLIDLSEQNQIPIVVGNERRRVFLRQTAVRLKKSIPDPLICNESLRGHHDKIYVDELDTCKGITQYYPDFDNWAGYSISTESILNLKKICDEKTETVENLTLAIKKLRDDLELEKARVKSQERYINALSDEKEALKEQNELLKAKEKKE